MAVTERTGIVVRSLPYLPVLAMLMGDLPTMLEAIHAMLEPVNDALPLEYQLINGCAVRNLDISDLMDDPAFDGVIRVTRHRFEEQLGDLVLRDVRSIYDHGPDSLLIPLNRI